MGSAVVQDLASYMEYVESLQSGDAAALAQDVLRWLFSAGAYLSKYPRCETGRIGSTLQHPNNLSSPPCGRHRPCCSGLLCNLLVIPL